MPSNLIPLKDYATRCGLDPATARQRAIRGAYATAVKLGRDWFIDKDEPHIDHRAAGRSKRWIQPESGD